jgi:DNA-3-methyladenine glycosylase II
MGGRPVEVAVEQTKSDRFPELKVSTKGRLDESAIESCLGGMLGLGIDLTDFHRIASTDKRLYDLVDRFQGLKPPRLPSVFEALVNGISCQQISLNVGIELLNRLSRRFGVSSGDAHAFPGPYDLRGVGSDELREMGYSRRKADYILGIARDIERGELDLESLELADDTRARDRLLRLTGVGRWTCEYVMLRGLGRLDILPADDLGFQQRLQRWMELGERPDYEAVRSLTRPWRPYRGLIYFYLLIDFLDRKGILPAL